MPVRGELKGFISWNGWYYGYKRLKSRNRYYRSKNVRFDDTCGVTEECSAEQYFEVAEKICKNLWLKGLFYGLIGGKRYG